jgi:type IV secretion system protein VirB8
MIDERLTEYLNYTKTFEQIEETRTRNKIKLLYVVSGALALVAASQAIAILYLTPLKEKIPVVFRVDNTKGTIEQVTELNVNEFNSDPNEELDKSNAAKYVMNRESYDYYNMQSNYQNTMLMTGENIIADYDGLYELNNKSNPYEKYGKDARIIIDIKNVTKFENSFVVRFERTLKTSSGSVSTTKELATITHKYSSDKYNNSDLLNNPLGYKVISYRVDKDISSIGEAK